jgi:hypothetical protein
MESGRSIAMSSEAIVTDWDGRPADPMVGSWYCFFVPLVKMFGAQSGTGAMNVASGKRNPGYHSRRRRSRNRAARSRCDEPSISGLSIAMDVLLLRDKVTLQDYRSRLSMRMAAGNSPSSQGRGRACVQAYSPARFTAVTGWKKRCPNRFATS